MNATPSSAPGFLAALLAVTRHDEFSVKISADDPNCLHVSISIGEHDPLEATGPAATLDAKLPAAIRQYAAWVESRIVPDGQVTINLPGERAKSKPARPAPKRARKKFVARKKPPAKPAAPKRPTPPRAAPMKKAGARHHASKPGKADCIADYTALKAKFGDKLNRPLFVKHAKTKRRYEKLWANNWPAFVKEAEGDKAAPPKPATAKAPAAAPAKKNEKKKTPATTATTPAKDDKRPWTVKAKGKTLGVTIFEKKPGDTFTCSAGNFIVQSVDPVKREVQAEAAGSKPAASAPAKAPDWPFPKDKDSKEKPGPVYAITTADGKKIGATIETLAIGALTGIGESQEVIAVDHAKREYTVKDRTASAAPAAQSTNATEPA